MTSLWKVQRSASVMLERCISDHGVDYLHTCKGTIDADVHIVIFGEAYVIIKLASFPWEVSGISAGQ